jgi:hypothetical protein
MESAGHLLGADFSCLLDADVRPSGLYRGYLTTGDNH